MADGRFNSYRTMRRFPKNESNHRTGPFCILALSQKYVRFFSCTGHSIEQRALDGKTPLSLKQAERFLDLHKELSAHGLASSSRPSYITHGHGAGREDEKLRIREFIAAVADGVDRVLREGRQPLVLAMVAYEASMFRQTSRYPYCTPEIIAGNPDLLSAKQLHARALAIVEKNGA